jgi:AcrR family transcriptional regulator
MVLTASPPTRKSGAPRWKRRAEARPDEILDAAQAEFDEKGFEAARMEDIGKRAGISKAAVYLYFPSKMALLKALIEAKVAPLAAQVETLAQAGQANPALALRMLATAAATRMAAFPKSPNIIARTSSKRRVPRSRT